MNNTAVTPVKMRRYVLCFFLVKLAIAGALVIYGQFIEGEPPVSSTIATIIAVVVPISWFIKAVKRPMLGSERMWFALGNAGAEVALTMAWAITFVIFTGDTFNWEGLGKVLSESDDPELAKWGLVIGMTVGLLSIPAYSALFGWLMTKNLAKER